MDLQELFEMQADLNDKTFSENKCYLYKFINFHSPEKEKIVSGTFRDLCSHIKSKTKGIISVGIPAHNTHAWIDIDSPNDWNKIQDWWLNAYNLAQRQETSEFTDTTNWKWWRSKVDKHDSEHAKVEAIDELHFWMSKCILLGLSAKDVDRIYKQKNAVNAQRQDEGYLTKKDDESHIK